VAELQKLGGASVILATAPNAQAISPLVNGLAPNGKCWCRRARRTTHNQCVLLNHETQFRCWLVFRDSEGFARNTLEFSLLSGVHPMIESIRLSDDGGLRANA